MKYSDEVLEIIRAASPLDKEGCATLADALTERFPDHEYNARGLIAKISRMDDVEYIKVAKTKKEKAAQPKTRKADIAAQIAAALQIPGLESLAKADASTLQILADAITALTQRETAPEVFA